MSTIEKAAELLRALADAPKKPPESEAAARPDHDPIERAVGEIGRRRDSAAPAVGSRPPFGTTRTFAIDPERLRAQSLVTPDGERTAVAESFRRIKRQILANVANPRPDGPAANLIMVTSTLAGEGKSYCAINLAISIALEVDRTVLLVDADVARASVPRVLGLQAEKGLMDALLDQRVDLADLMWKTDIGGLMVLPAGKAHKRATELIASEAMHRLLRDLAEGYHDRIVLFDSPPLLAASEAGALASQMGQIIVVVEAGRTSEAALKEALRRIDGSRIAGLLLNKVEGHSLGYGYGYDGYG